jgi:putative endonuclease
LCHASEPSPHIDERPARADNFSGGSRSKRLGTVFEARALEYLRRQQLRLVARNVTCRGGEIDLVMRAQDGVLVFVEVRARAGRNFGGAIASVSREKRRRIVHAAEYFLATRGEADSACRFDVVAFDGYRVEWLRDAFRADGA